MCVHHIQFIKIASPSYDTQSVITTTDPTQPVPSAIVERPEIPTDNDNDDRRQSDCIDNRCGVRRSVGRITAGHICAQTWTTGSGGRQSFQFIDIDNGQTRVWRCQSVQAEVRHGSGSLQHEHGGVDNGDGHFRLVFRKYELPTNYFEKIIFSK